MQTKTKTRSQELTEAIAAATAELDDARDRLGLAVADGDEAGAASARADVARLERLLSELNSARPIALRREAEARRVAEEKAQRERERAQNKARAARVAAAAKVDKALAALGRAYSDYLATEPGGRPEERNRLARRSRHAIAAAAFHAAPEFATAMDPHRRPPRQHWASLADAAGKTLGEFQVADEDDAE